MTNLKTLTAIGATVALVAAGSLALAQDDLDDLLKDLEGDATAEQVESPKSGEDEHSAAPEESAQSNDAVVAESAEPDTEADSVTDADAAEDADVAETPVKAEDAAAEPVEEAKAAESDAEKEPAPEATADNKAEEGSATPAEEAKPAVAAEEVKPESAENADSTDELSALDELAEDSDVQVAQTPAKANIPEGDAELIANIRTMEQVRRKAFDSQARREVTEARQCMEAREYMEAEKHYRLAFRLLNDRPGSAKLRRECEQGMAESLYRAALLEEQTGRRDRAIELMESAIDMRHPKARRQLESWLKEGDPSAQKTDVSEIEHRKNEEDFKALREKTQKHLRRARQLLSTREIDRAIDECELVLVSDPYNQEAIRLRDAIQKKRHTILKQEFESTRDGYIADVTKAWRPVYAPNARQIDDVAGTTVKKSLGDDPERSLEQSIIQRMREMRLPTISFKPPATIIDAVEYFRGASKDFDRPDLPLDQRGFNFVLKTPETLRASVSADVAADDSGFGSDAADDSQGSQSGIPVIPMITASNITFYDALKLVCESVDYKFKVQGPIVMVMQKNMSTDEMVTRSYPVVAAFLERIGSATSDIKELKSASSFGSSNSSKRDDGEENQERDWKEFFSLMGVQWPEGSSILYIKTLGKLRVKNTYENLAELEKALTELNVDQKLIEIEARFVEVCQEDLNSLGFEWILNSDYSLNAGGALGKWLGVNNGKWNVASGGSSSSGSGSSSGDISTGGGTIGTLPGSSSSSSSSGSTSGSTWVRGDGGSRNIGINAFGGSSDYNNGNRYLSTVGNHISGSENSTNDQFMRVNAFLGSADLSMILHMLSQRSDTDLLSAPKVLTRPGEQAVIKVVTEYIYPTDYDVQLQSSSSSSSGNSSGGQSAILAVVEPQSFVTREVGVILDVTPTLTDDGNLIDLKLNTQVVDEPTWKNYGMRIPFTGNSSSASYSIGFPDFPAEWNVQYPEDLIQSTITKVFDAYSNMLDNLFGNSQNITYYDAPMEQPFFHVRSVDSSVSIYPGATIVMGGLITEARKAMDDKIPFLGDLPFIGRLFRSHAEQTTKRNLLIFVTTRLVDVRGREVSMGTSGVDDSAEVKEAPKAQ